MKPGIILAEEAVKGELSFNSKKRIDAGIELLNRGLVEILILSGGVRKRKGFKKIIGKNESFARIMENYAIGKGIDKNKIIVEDLSEDTVGQIIFVNYGILKPKKINSGIIVTNDFHAPKIFGITESIFGKGHEFEFLFIPSSKTERENRPNLKSFYETFKKINFNSEEEILSVLLAKHPFYSKDPTFYREGLERIRKQNDIKISYGRQTIDEQDLVEVVKTLKSDFLTCGPKIHEFEEEFSKAVGSKYAVAVSSGTAGLHLACLAIGLKKGDEVITTPMTFAASSNCILYCGAKPVFVDIDEKTGLIDENRIEEKISKKTKAIIPVHYAGMPCNMEKIKKISEKYKLKIIEDSCHALGAKYKDSKIGDCEYSDISVFSFHPVKHITTGEGGIITTNSRKIYEELLKIRSHGIEKKEDWKQEMTSLGYNYRLTDFQCALGISQLKKLDSFVRKRRDIAENYNRNFKDKKDIEILEQKKDSFNSYHLYAIKLKSLDIKKNLYNFLKENNIFCQVHYIPVYLHPYYKKLGYEKGLCQNAENFYEKILSVPMHPSIKENEQKHVINKIKEFFNQD